MSRILLAAAAVALAVTAVAAQSDPIAARKALMKKNGDEAKAGAAMAKGEAPFDLTKAQAIFVFRGHEGRVWRADFSGDGRAFVRYRSRIASIRSRSRMASST